VVGQRHPAHALAVVVTNDDTAVHVVGPIVLGSRQTYRIPFRRPGRFQYACSLHAAGRLTIVVASEPQIGLERLRWRLMNGRV
jgi:plastocyanin